MSKRHQANRRRSYGRRQHELHELHERGDRRSGVADPLDGAVLADREWRWSPSRFARRASEGWPQPQGI
ncbi:MAG: hypothetical protein ABSA21_08680 [Candidatus Limnocylindrales bacterium]|jgi:hypothetical protein